MAGYNLSVSKRRSTIVKGISLVARFLVDFCFAMCNLLKQ